MLKTLKGMLAAAVIAVMAPITASAATLNAANSGGTFDLLADSYDFNTSYNLNAPGSTLSWSFINNSASSAFAFFAWATQQNALSFRNGVTFTFGPYSGSALASQNVSSDNGAGLRVASGGNVVLTMTYGTVFDHRPLFRNSPANINFNVVAANVPLPAGGLLLLTALGAAAAMRRRRKVDATA